MTYWTLILWVGGECGHVCFNNIEIPVYPFSLTIIITLKNFPYCYWLPIHNSNGYSLFNQLYLPYFPNCSSVELLCLFLVLQ